jgi:hypothetical protein
MKVDDAEAPTLLLVDSVEDTQHLVGAGCNSHKCVLNLLVGQVSEKPCGLLSVRVSLRIAVGDVRLVIFHSVSWRIRNMEEEADIGGPPGEVAGLVECACDVLGIIIATLGVNWLERANNLVRVGEVDDPESNLVAVVPVGNESHLKLGVRVLLANISQDVLNLGLGLLNPRLH